MKTMVVVIGILLSPAWALADGDEPSKPDGNRLLKDCGAVVALLDDAKSDIAESYQVGFCVGFMQGVTQTNLVYQSMVKDKAQFCLPAGGIQNGQAARVVVKYLRDHPENLHMNQTVLAFWAFKAAFPCKKSVE